MFKNAIDNINTTTLTLLVLFCIGIITSSISFASIVDDNTTINTTLPSTVLTKEITPNLTILEEIRNFIYINLDIIIALAAPLSGLLLFIANRIIAKIDNEHKELQFNITNNKKLITEEINKVEKRLESFMEKHDHLEKRVNNLEIEFRIDLNTLKILSKLSSPQDVFKTDLFKDAELKKERLKKE